MSRSPAASKSPLRREMEVRRLSLDGATVAARSVEACRRLRALPEWARAETVALYAALRGEVDPAVLASAAHGKRLVFPRMAEGERRLGFYLAGGLDELVRGRHGVLEPGPGAEAVDLSAIDLFVIPGVAFDAAGHRLGRGGGHYDATLAAARPDAFRVGLAFDWQIVPPLDADAWDEGTDVIVTDEKVLRTGRRSVTRTP